jgi:SH3 domain-containing YSC84-like protein 1
MVNTISHRARSPGKLCILLTTLVAALGFFLALGAEARAEDAAARAAALAQSSERALEQFFNDPKWVALRNMMGGARAIYVAPTDKEAGFLLADAGGDGVLVRRHGADWSDPVFMTINQVSLGMQAGVAEQSLVMVIMTDQGVDDLLAGVLRVGGGGQFTLANLGVGGGGAGGISGGLQVLTVSTSQGLFGGGGISGMTMAPKDAFNTAIYGTNADLAGVLAQSGGRMAGAETLRATLRRAVEQSWGR